MKYMGGKFRIAKHLRAAIEDHQASVEDLTLNPIRHRHFWEPFCGGCNFTSEMAPFTGVYHASDVNPDLINMWRAVKEGWIPPNYVSENDYNEYRMDYKEGRASPTATFAGFACSWGAKFWGGYARSGKRNFADEASRAIMKQAPALRHAVFTCRPYYDARPCRGDLVYCDPPYEGTTGYKTGDFDHKEFWDKMREWAEGGSYVYVSEFNAPEDFVPIWSVAKGKSLVADKGDIDSLYVHESQLEKGSDQ